MSHHYVVNTFIEISGLELFYSRSSTTFIVAVKLLLSKTKIKEHKNLAI